MKKKKFIPDANLKKILKHRDHPRLDDTESQTKQDFADGSGFLAEMREMDFAADEALKSHALTTS